MMPSNRLRALFDTLSLFTEIRLDRLMMGQPHLIPIAWEEAMKAASRSLGVDPAQLTESALADIEASVADRVGAMHQTGEMAGHNNADMNLARTCYLMCRALRPGIVVETGVAFGVTSAFMLQALAENRHGQLYSIDAPPNEIRHEMVGSLVPANLRSRWCLRLGTSYDILPGLLRELGRADMFLHDSRHTYRVTSRELNEVTPRLAYRAVVLVDDVQKNVAFSRWVERWSPAYSAAVRQQGKDGMFGIAVLIQNTRSPGPRTAYGSVKAGVV